ncbi:MAG: metallophosphoesterase family protein [bacterium]
MRIAVLSDIHGNGVALDAVLADIPRQSVDAIVCLGDAVQGGPQPADVVARLREIACPVVMGNADAWLLSGATTRQENIAPERLVKMQAVREWSLAQLSEQDRAFIARFAPTVTVNRGGRRLLCFHGSPSSFDDVILPTTPEDEVQRLLGAHAEKQAGGHAGTILAGGHTHLQQIRRVGGGFFFNPGSVGLAYAQHQPEEHFRVDPWAEYAVLTLESSGTGLEFRRVPFDTAELIRRYRESGRPHADDAVAEYEGEGP